jgi:hypothetical protein
VVATSGLVMGLVVVAHPAAATTAATPKKAPTEVVRERPDPVSATAAARAQGSKVEISSMRTETTTSYALPNGSRQLWSFSGLVRFRDGTDAWKDVDLTLVRHPDGSVRPLAHPGGLRLAGGGGAAGQPQEVVGVQTGGQWVGLGWSGSLPAPALKGTTATYAGISPGLDMVVTATRSGFSQDFLLHNRPSDGALRLGGRSHRA